MKPKTVVEYIDSFPEDKKVKLTEIRAVIREALPDTSETLKWNAPATLDQDGMILIVFSGHKEHINFVVTPSAKQAFEHELADYEGGKGSIKLQYDKPIPAALLKKIALYRVKEYRENGVKWK